LVTSGANTDGETLAFKVDQYEGRLRDIDIYLSTLKRPKDGVPLRVIGNTETNQILKEFHNTFWARHRRIWVTYNKIKKQY
jgi:hypothetical protein